jgi:hypothetical protein
MNEKLKWITALLVCITIGSISMMVYYYNRYQVLSSNYNNLLSDLNEVSIFVDIKIDYGNGNYEWQNETLLPIGSTLFEATIKIADVEYTSGEFGIFIESINGVKGGDQKFWMWNYYDEEKGEWALGPVASDQWMINDGDTLSWVYTK